MWTWNSATLWWTIPIQGTSRKVSSVSTMAAVHCSSPPANQKSWAACLERQLWNHLVSWHFHWITFVPFQCLIEQFASWSKVRPQVWIRPSSCTEIFLYGRYWISSHRVCEHTPESKVLDFIGHKYWTENISFAIVISAKCRMSYLVCAARWKSQLYIPTPAPPLESTMNWRWYWAYSKSRIRVLFHGSCGQHSTSALAKVSCFAASFSPRFSWWSCQLS